MPITVATDGTMMIFQRVESGSGDRLFLRHYGAKVADVEGALAVTDHDWQPSSLGRESPVAYSTFGETGSGLDRFGGLKVTHDDGTQTLDLVIDGIDQADGGLTVRWRDAVHDFRVTQHFRPRPDADVVKTWVELANNEAGAFRITRMSSF